MTKKCFIIEDLLSLYEEGLLQEETEAWMNEHLKHCESCQKKSELTTEPIIDKQIESPVNYEKIMMQNNLKIAFYQLIFIGISFFIAIKSVITEQLFSFILTYAVLGFVTYLFYKKYKLVTLIAFLPVFLWVVGTGIMEMKDIALESNDSIVKAIVMLIYSAVVVGGVHLIFALVGATIALFTLKLTEREEVS